MATVVISPCNVVNFIEGGGGHFWVYMQYAAALRKIGCDVWWLERVRRPDEGADSPVPAFAEMMERFGLAGKFILYESEEEANGELAPLRYLNTTPSAAQEVFRRADLLLNFFYAIDPALLAQFRRTALVDIDPGLLQFWMKVGQIRVAPHDAYLTTGETVGTPAARFPDGGLVWHHIRPCVFLDHWPFHFDPACEAFTTVSSWWGTGDWILGEGADYENNKRVTFLDFADLPRHTSQPLELALFLSEEEHDQRDRHLMESRGWRIRHSLEVSRTPQMYQSYIRQSRGEFSCVKPSCINFANAWVSDRTLCYLATGKPVVVQHTGPSAFLPSGEGMFRFTTIDEAARAFDIVNADYRRHCDAARGIAETHFDATAITRTILNVALRS